MAGTTSWLKSEITRAGGITACARQLGVSTTAVEHWYTGRNRPDNQHATALATWLGVPEVVLRQQLGMPTFGTEDAAEIYKAGGRRVLLGLMVALEQALDELDADDQIRKSS